MLLASLTQHVRTTLASLLVAAIGSLLWVTAAQAQESKAASEAATAEGIEFFEKHIRPLVAQNCLSCHGDKKQGGLQLDSRSASLVPQFGHG